MTTGAATAPRTPDAEARLYLALTRRLPKVYGVGALANVLKRVYARKRRAVVDLDVHGFRMELDPNEYLDRELMFTPQLYDREMLDHVRRALRPGDTFLDAGANVGMFSLLASRHVGPSGRVLSVDADPRVFAILKRNLDRNACANVTAVNTGLGDAAGTLRFSYGVEGMRGVGSFLAQGKGDIDVAVQPLAEVATKHGFDRFTMVKIDIEGFEHRVLKRYLDDVPRERWPRSIIVERLPHMVERAGGDVVAMLVERGYHIAWQDRADHIMALA